MSFSDLSLDASLLRALTEAGYSEPTPIQAQAIPAALEGHDLIASAQTGTGKTAAFMLPALQRFAVASGDRRRAPRVLVLTPTRELAAQVMDAAHKYGRFLRFTTVSLLGGMPYGPQLRALGGPLDLVVATPGRLIDHLDRDRIDLSKIEVLVLDEADRMLDLGFKEDVERIAEATPAGRQTLLFTATLDGAMARLAAELTRDAVRIAIEPTQTEQLNIEQRLHVADDLAHKHRLLDHLLKVIGEEGPKRRDPHCRTIAIRALAIKQICCSTAPITALADLQHHLSDPIDIADADGFLGHQRQA